MNICMLRLTPTSGASRGAFPVGYVKLALHRGPYTEDLAYPNSKSTLQTRCCLSILTPHLVYTEKLSSVYCLEEQMPELQPAGARALDLGRARRARHHDARVPVAAHRHHAHRRRHAARDPRPRAGRSTVSDYAVLPRSGMKAILLAAFTQARISVVNDRKAVTPMRDVCG